MAVKKVPMGEGMTKNAGGAWSYEKNLPDTPTTAADSKAC